jgi:competence protein ComEA
MAEAQSVVNAGAPSNQLAGAAKYGAVGILGFLAGAGTLWSVSTREPAPIAAAQQPAPVQQAPIIVQPPQVVIHMPPQGSPSPTMNPGDSGMMGPMPSAPDSNGAPAEIIVPVVISPPTPTATPETPTPAPAETAPSRTAKLNLNAATAAQLELLPGIGPSLASRIVAYRTAHGRFGSITELDKVDGIGPKTLERLVPLVTVE